MNENNERKYICDVKTPTTLSNVFANIDNIWYENLFHLEKRNTLKQQKRTKELLYKWLQFKTDEQAWKHKDQNR